jgi:prevent-host-death family protein
MKSDIPGRETSGLTGGAKMYNTVHYRGQAPRGGPLMKHVSFSEFRRNAASLFDAVESGETVLVLRHGKPVAEIVPVSTPKTTVSWKRPAPLIRAGKASLSREILKERTQGR